MKQISSFNAVYCSGLFIFNQSSLASLSLLFNKIYFPSNLEIALELAKKIRIINYKEPKLHKTVDKLEFSNNEGSFDSVINDFTEEQKKTLYQYLTLTQDFCSRNFSLFGEVFETSLFEKGRPYEFEFQSNTNLIKRIGINPISFSMNDKDKIPNLINQGYLPIIDNIPPGKDFKKSGFTNLAAKNLAAILATKAVEMFFPAAEPVRPDLIMEARDKLSDHLPAFWSSMLKLSRDLKKLVVDCTNYSEILIEGQDLVDTIVRPALIDLNEKIEKDRKQWFYRIFGHTYKGLKLLVGNPPTTPDHLVKGSIGLGADLAKTTIDDFYRVENMKSEVGLTYLCELGKHLR